jgi:hypothetical protein
LTQRIVDENLHALKRIGGIRLLVEIADSIELLDQIDQDTIGEDVVHGRISSVGKGICGTPAQLSVY